MAQIARRLLWLGLAAVILGTLSCGMGCSVVADPEFEADGERLMLIGTLLVVGGMLSASVGAFIKAWK